MSYLGLFLCFLSGMLGASRGGIAFAAVLLATAGTTIYFTGS
jgi:hypothetical protein